MTQTLVRSPVNIDERKNLGIRSGDTVRVWQKIPEKGKVRLQSFEGLVLSCKHGTEAGATFTVRKVASGVGVEKIFPLYSPNIDRIEILKRSKTRRAKLYYIREKVAREIKRQMRGAQILDVSTGSDIAQKEQAKQEAAEAQARAKAEEERRVQEEAEAAQAAQTPSEETPDADTPSEESK